MNKHYYMLNKPQGYLSAVRDENRPTVMELFPQELRDILHPVGRLDKDTEGLLLFTDDGRLDHYLLMPENNIKKEYLFYSFGTIGEEAIKKVSDGIEMYGSGALCRPATLEIIGNSTVENCSEYLPPYRKRKYLHNPQGEVTIGKITVTEGKKHEVKLIIRSIGCKVFYLKRLSINDLCLDKSLELGKYRELTEEEKELVGINRL